MLRPNFSLLSDAVGSVSNLDKMNKIMHAYEKRKLCICYLAQPD